MKKIEAFVPSFKFTELKQALSRMENHGLWHLEARVVADEKHQEVRSGIQFESNLKPMSMIMLLVEDDHAEKAVATICEVAQTESEGSSRVWTTHVENFVVIEHQ